MTNSNSVNSRKAVTSLFATMLLLSAVISQDFPSSAQERERRSDVSKTASAALFTLAETVAAPALTITPITWGVVGLDSNNVNDGPNLFPVGARVCNTGSDPATNVASAFVWDSANALINLRTGSVSSLSLPTLAAGACTDFYYEVEITRSTAAYAPLTRTRGFHITATADTLGVISTPTPRDPCRKACLAEQKQRHRNQAQRCDCAVRRHDESGRWEHLHDRAHRLDSD